MSNRPHMGRTAPIDREQDRAGSSQRGAAAPSRQAVFEAQLSGRGDEPGCTKM
jgi:hypothetical protein